MKFPLVSETAIDEERLRRAVAHLAKNGDIQIVLRHVAAERLRNLNVLSSISPTDPEIAKLQGRAQGYAWLIGLFNQVNDEE